MPSDDSWDFKVEDKKQKPSKPGKKKLSAIGREKRKRRLESSEQSENVKVDIEAPQKVRRKSRSELAKEYEREEDKRREPHPHEIYGSLIRRGSALAMDVVFCLGAMMALLTFFPEFWIDIEMSLFGFEDYGQGPLLTYFGSLVLLLYLFLTVTPTIVFGRSLGKSLAGIKVYGPNHNALGFMKTFLREIVFKPIGFVSVVGIFMCYLSKQRKMLHDHLSGSTVEKF